MARPRPIEPRAARAARLRVPRTRGAVSGLLLLLLGAWAALGPFVGPQIDVSFTPDRSWHWTTARGWYEVLPGSVVAVGGLLLMLATSRIGASLGGWLAALGGAWLAAAPVVAGALDLGALGRPTSSSDGGRAAQTLLLFTGTGVVIVFLAGAAIGRLAVVGVRDVRAAYQADERLEHVEPPVAAPTREVPVAEPEPAVGPDDNRTVDDATAVRPGRRLQRRPPPAPPVNAP